MTIDEAELRGLMEAKLELQLPGMIPVPDAVLALLDEIERLRGELERARAEERERCIEVVRTAPVKSAVHVRDELALAIEHLKYRP